MFLVIYIYIYILLYDTKLRIHLNLMYYLYGGKFKMFIEKNYDLVSKSVHMV